MRSVFSKINGKSVSNCYFALTEGKLSFSVIETFNFTTCFQSVKKLNVSKKLNVQKWNRNKLASEQTLRGGKRKESLQLRLWNLNICIVKVDAKC